MNTATFILPSWSNRLKLLISFAAFVVWAASHQYWLIPMAASVECADPCTQLKTLRLIVTYVALLPMPASLWFAWNAQRILNSGQAPPPGSWQMFKTEVSIGSQAKLAAYCHLGMGLCAALGTGYLAYALDWSYVFCVAAPCACETQ